MQSGTAPLCRFLDWDSAHFGMRVGRVMPRRADCEGMREALGWAASENIDCMYLLADSSDPVTARSVQDAGFRMVGVRAGLGVTLAASAGTDGAGIRPAAAGDVPYLRQLASRSHYDSRFYADGRFSREACDRLFSMWIERSCTDSSFAGAVFVPEIDGQPAGYITCAMKEGAGEIGLIAVDERSRNQGLGAKLLARAEQWFAAQGAPRAGVVTQASNVKALRMYERHGFRIESIGLWFHWWNAG